MYSFHLKISFVLLPISNSTKSLHLYFNPKRMWSSVITISLCIIYICLNWQCYNWPHVTAIFSLPLTNTITDVNEINFIAKFYHNLQSGVLAAQIQLLRASRTLFKLFLMSMIQRDVRDAKHWPFLCPAAQPSVSTRLIAPAIFHWPFVLLQGAYLSAVLN